MKKTKPFDIPKALVKQAYDLVKAKAGAAGVDQQSLEEYGQDWQNNLYKLWNRLSSGCYFPPPVKAVPIPKKQGGIRVLGVPTVADRIAQTVVRLVLEPKLEPIFLGDSYGYRPNKSALDAVGVTRERCWRYNWVLEYDIAGLFDNISHELLLKAVCKHTDCKWIILYIERWLKAPMQDANGELQNRTCGTPQGGVVSPVLSNLFLHYAFDVWMQKHYPTIPWCRYADDGLMHCKTLKQAQFMLDVLRKRFAECGLELHPEKTKIVYCKDDRRKEDYPETQFDFLGYTFRRRQVRNKETGQLFVSFNPSVSKASVKTMRAKTRQLNWRNRTDLSLNEIAKRYNPVLQGWFNYYGRYNRSGLYSVWRHFNKTLVSWAMAKYKRLKGRKIRASEFIAGIARREPSLFAHWRNGMIGSFI